MATERAFAVVQWRVGKQGAALDRSGARDVRTTVTARGGELEMYTGHVTGLPACTPFAWRYSYSSRQGTSPPVPELYGSSITVCVRWCAGLLVWVTSGCSALGRR